MPDLPPYALGAADAAAFCGISRTGFLRAVDAGDAPQPVSPTPKRRVWLRRALEEWLDRLAGSGATSRRHNPFALDAGQNALRPDRSQSR